MRRVTAAGWTTVAMLLMTTAAHAAGGVGGKGDSGGKGGNSPGAGPSGESRASADFEPGTGSIAANANPDLAQAEARPQKKWEVGGAWETHALIRREDLNGAAVNKTFNVLGLYAQYDFTPNDRVSLRDYIFEYFVADPGESGLRSDDVTAQYTRTQPLPQQFTLFGKFSASAPTSFLSNRLMHLITNLVGIVQLDKKLGRYVSVSGRTSGSGFIVEKAEMEGGSPNPKFRLGFSLEGEVAMPFHEALSVGADISTRYTWLYNVGGQIATSTPSQPTGVVDNSQNQPLQQSYGGEIFARYTLPQIYGMHSDVVVAYANGDPSLGYTSVLHDGIGHTYLFYRQTSEFYATLTLRY